MRAKYFAALTHALDYDLQLFPSYNLRASGSFRDADTLERLKPAVSFIARRVYLYSLSASFYGVLGLCQSVNRLIGTSTFLIN